GRGVRGVKAQRDPTLAQSDGLDFLGGTEDIPRVMAESDFVLVCMPLTAQTDGLIGEREIARMKPTAFLMNVGRGRVVAEAPLFRALRDRAIAGAAIDVCSTRPPVGQLGQPGNCPFQTLSNVIMTPHIAGWTNGTVRRRMGVIARNVLRVARGEEPRNVVARA